jgi:formylglycine-generating enzyme required for sulfatase activity
MSKVTTLRLIPRGLLFLALLLLSALFVAPITNAQAISGTKYGDLLVQNDQASSGVNLHTGTRQRDMPEMVTIAPGEFTMGSAVYGPPHRVRIGYSFAVGKYPITVTEFAKFVRETGYNAGGQCYTHVGAAHGTLTSHSWKNPGVNQGETSPVVCIDWDDAQAYAAWLSKTTGQMYRLLSEAEYEYINRAGTTTAYWWGDVVGSAHANCDGCGSAWDGKQASPVGSFAPNAFGLFDTTGNVWSWTADCWRDGYAGAAADGSSITRGDCTKRVIRGGSWGHDPGVILSRHGIDSSTRDFFIGFRLAKTL